MPAKPYAGVAAIIFVLVAVVHGARAAMGFDVIIASYSMPIYVSIVIAVISAVLALIGFMVSR